jgi:FKBP-type peptidyl-prolyl cis-trans isomerase SlyD
MADQATTNTIQDKSWFVKLNYRVRVPNGRIIKGAVDPDTLEFVTGYQQVIPGLEKRLIGHTRGDKLSFTVPPEEAFGPRYEQLVIEKRKEDFHFPQGYYPFVGMELPIILSRDEGPDTVIIKEIKEETIVVDGNHPLAGSPLQYDLEIIEARPAQANEVCAEWDGSSNQSCASGSCSGGPKEIILGQSEN